MGEYMIKILDSNFKRQAILNKAIKPNRFEEINGENTLTFSAILDQKVSNYLNENSIIELEEDYFDIAYLEKKQNADGTLSVDVETEHISYRLNKPEYNKDFFTRTGTPNYILGQILAGTGFNIGTIEFTNTVTYSAQEKKSRRALLMEFVALLGGELDFNKFEISILQHRGKTEPQLLVTGKNIKVVSRICNKRETDKSGNPLISYACEPMQLPNKVLSVGDEVLLVHKDLGIRETMRVVRIGYNPYDFMESEIELANFISGLEDDIYRIQTTTVVKEKIYNGCRIGPEEGFVAERSDLKAKSIMNATEGISIYSDAGQGLERNFYVDMDGRIKGRRLDILEDATFGGTIQTAKDAIIGLNLTLGNLEDSIPDRHIRFINNNQTDGYNSEISWLSDLVNTIQSTELELMGYSTGDMPSFNDGLNISSDNLNVDIGNAFALNADGIFMDSGFYNMHLSSGSNLTLSGDLIEIQGNSGFNVQVADNEDINISTGGNGNINFSVNNGSLVLPDYSYLINGTDEDYRIVPEYVIRQMIDNAVSAEISNHVSSYHTV